MKNFQSLAGPWQVPAGPGRSPGCQVPRVAGPPGRRSQVLQVEPPDRAEIGRAAWRYLHAMAAQHDADAAQAQARQTWG